MGLFALLGEAFVAGGEQQRHRALSAGPAEQPYEPFQGGVVDQLLAVVARVVALLLSY